MHNKSKTSMASLDKSEMQEYNFLKQKNEQLAKELAQTKTSYSNLQADIDYLLKEKFDYEQKVLRLSRMLLIIDERSKKSLQLIVESSTEQAWLNNTVNEVKKLLNIHETTDETNRSKMTNTSSKNITPARKSVQNNVENVMQGAEVSTRIYSLRHHSTESDLRSLGAEDPRNGTDIRRSEADFRRSEADSRRSEANLQEKAESPHDFISRGGQSLPALSDVEIENSNTESKDDTSILQFSSINNRKLSVIDEDMECSSSNAEEADNIGATIEDSSSFQTTFFNQLPKPNVNTRRGRSRNDDNNLSINVEPDSRLYQSHLDDSIPNNSGSSLDTNVDDSKERNGSSKGKSTDATYDNTSSESRQNDDEGTLDVTPLTSPHSRKEKRLSSTKRQSFIKRKSLGSPCPRSREERNSKWRKSFSPKARPSQTSTREYQTRSEKVSQRNSSGSFKEVKTPNNSVDGKTSYISTGTPNANRTSGKSRLSRKTLFGKESDSEQPFEKNTLQNSSNREAFGNRFCLDMNELKNLISSTPIVQEPKPKKRMQSNEQHNEHPLANLAKPTSSSKQNDTDDPFSEDSPVRNPKTIKRTLKKNSMQDTAKKISRIKGKDRKKDQSPGRISQEKENNSLQEDGMDKSDSTLNSQRKKRKCTSYKYSPWALYEQVVAGHSMLEFSSSEMVKDFAMRSNAPRNTKKKNNSSRNTSEKDTKNGDQLQNKTEDSGDEINQRPLGRKRRAAQMVDYKEPSLALKLRREN